MCQLYTFNCFILAVSLLGLAHASIQSTPAGTLPGFHPDSLFGANVALVGDRLFVGAPQEDNLSGAIRLYDLYSADLLLTIEGGREESLGKTFSVSDDGRFLAIVTLGSVVVHEIDETTNSLMEMTYIDMDATNVELSSDGTKLAVTDDYDAFATGRVSIYTRDTMDSNWDLQVEFIGDSNRAMFGSTLSFSQDSNRIAIAASNQSTNDIFRAGLVRVFDQMASGDWIQVGQDLTGVAERDQFGTALALSADGSTLVVGIEHSQGLGRNQGCVQVFSLANMSVMWEQVGRSLYGEQDLDRFGESVAVTHDGGRIVATSYFHRAQRGQVRVFDLLENGDWDQVLEMEGEAQGDRLGYGRESIAVSSDGSILVTGASDADGFQPESGEVFITQLAGPDIEQPNEEISVPSDAPSMHPTLSPSTAPSVAPSTMGIAGGTVVDEDMGSMDKIDNDDTVPVSSSVSVVPGLVGSIMVLLSISSYIML